ncbi:MAG: RNA pseudouridine synthase [Bacteroidales bacterium]|nr:RNA pseudouridine synthase [Bacteroidales bacterium]
MQILYEDNHLVILNKRVSDIVQGDKTGDISLDERLRKFIKERDGKPGNVFIGIPHRLDRPVSGAIVYTKTSKALSRMTKIFREKEAEKIYHAIVRNKPEVSSGILEHYIVKNAKQNKSYCSDHQKPGSKQAVLEYRYLASSDQYHLLEILLNTGRHHQIRAQLAAIGCPVKGDVKYGAGRPNRNGGISLHARKIAFGHPVKKDRIDTTAPYPEDDIFEVFKP